MVTDFERGVKAAYMKAKFGDRIDEIAGVELHFVLPLPVFYLYEALISEVTDGKFNVAGAYNLVLLYTDPQDSLRAGTVMFSRELGPLIAAWSRVLDEIAEDPNKASRLQKFNGAHSFFRSSLWRKSNPSDPCASANPLLKRSDREKKSLWDRFLSKP